MMNGNYECYRYMTKKKYTNFKRTDFVQGDLNRKNSERKTPEDVYTEKKPEILGVLGRILRVTEMKREELENSRKFKVVKANINSSFKQYFKEPPKVKNLENILTENEKNISAIKGYI